MKLRVIDAFKTVEDDGYRQSMPIVHVIGRDQSWERQHIPIDGFRNYFLVRQSEWVEKGEEVGDDERILDVETTDRRGRQETAIDGEPLFRIVCRTPDDVRDLREVFDDPFEADVKYPVRFLVDFDAKQWIEVPDDTSERTISADEVSIGVDEESEQTPPPRLCTYDIEVKQGGDGPPVVSKDGTEQARNPITAITAHDSYTDEYKMWVLANGNWDIPDYETARDAVNAQSSSVDDDGNGDSAERVTDVDVNIYSNPQDVAGLFCEWIVERGFDALTAWNGNGFDHPYLVNYCLNHGVNAVYDLSPTGDVYDMNGHGNWINSSLKGRLLVDLMELYDKTEIHSLDSYRLEDVAEENGVSVGKLSIEDEIDVPEDEPAIDYAWANHPDVFTKYSLRDVKAAVAINRESKGEVSIL